MDIVKSVKSSVDMLTRTAYPEIGEALDQAQKAMELSDESRKKSELTKTDESAGVYLTEALVHEQRAANLIALVGLRLNRG